MLQGLLEKRLQAFLGNQPHQGIHHFSPLKRIRVGMLITP